MCSAAGFIALSLSLVNAGEGASPLLKTLNSDASEKKRLEALQHLERGGGIDAQQLLRMICDTSPAIRAAAVRIGSPMVVSDPELELRLIALSNDRSPLVQEQMLKSLPGFPSQRAAAALQKLISNCRKSTDPRVSSLADSLGKAP